MEPMPKLAVKKKSWPLLSSIESTLKDFWILKPGDPAWTRAAFRVLGTLFILLVIASVFFDLRQPDSLHLLLSDLVGLGIGVGTAIFFAGIKLVSLKYPQNRLATVAGSLPVQIVVILLSFIGAFFLRSPDLLPFRLASIGAFTTLCLSLIWKTGIVGIALKGAFGGTISYFTQRWWKSRETKKSDPPATPPGR